MTDLSPAAQAVLDAAFNTDENLPYEHDIAAALRALADQVMTHPEVPPSIRDYARAEILAIAAELEGVN